MNWLNSDLKVVNMFYAQMFSHEAFFSKLLPWCLEVLQSFIKISLHSFILETSRFCTGHCANQQVHRDLAWTACNVEVAGTWLLFFLLSKQKAAYSWAQIFEKQKKTPTALPFLPFWNEMRALWLFNKVDLLSKLLSPSQSNLDWVICCNQKKSLSVICLCQSFCLFILTT